MSKNVQLIAIDCQNDFMDQNNATLPVPGGMEDMKRLANLINRLSRKITDITATLDSHHVVQIFHQAYWVDGKGAHPDPFTSIKEEDVLNGTWLPTNPSWRQKSLDYVRHLAANNSTPLMIWKNHCLIGSWGHSLVPCVSDALIKWETDNFGLVNYEVKGDDIWTEHYGALASECPRPDNPATMLNTRLIDILQEADELLIGGEALNFCVRSTVNQVALEFGDENIKKFVLLTDCTSNVPGLEKLGTDFVRDMTARGMQVTTSVDYLA